ncbi:MAG TPA: ABC transporter permease [Planctomycetota bacterium]|jgi:peptide/nickel transport system permease protein|nr:ABC transporter permease [Planctomycetota bacterium]
MKRGAIGGAFALVAAAALAPLLAHELPLAGRFAGELRFPVLRCLSGEDRLWFLLLAGICAAFAVAARRRGRRAGVLVAAAGALGFSLLACCGGGRANLDELDWRAARAAGRATVVPTPVGFGPLESDDVAITAGVLPAPPSARHWLGTDGSARDVAARLLHGMRVSLATAVAATAVALGLGLLVGLACGAWRGFVDLALMRVVEVFLCFPQMFLVLVVFAYLPHGRTTLALLLGVVGWTTTAQIARAEFLRLHGEEFVVAARALGVPAWRLALRHLLPNALEPLAVAATFGVAGALLAEFTLSFLGFGVPPPTPSLGQMLAEGKGVLETAPWIALLPGTTIFLVVIGVNALGESLRGRSSALRRRPAAPRGSGA